MRSFSKNSIYHNDRKTINFLNEYSLSFLALLNIVAKLLTVVSEKEYNFLCQAPNFAYDCGMWSVSILLDNNISERNSCGKCHSCTLSVSSLGFA